MNEEIVVALLGALGSGAGALVGVLASSKLTQYRIEQLEKKVETHNNLIDRMYKVEQHEAVIEEEIEQLKAYHR